MKHRFALVLLLIVFTFAIGTLAQDSDFPPPLAEDQQVTITFFSYNLDSPIFGAGIESLLNSFSEAHPNIIVEALPYNLASPAASALANLAAGEQQDVLQLTFDDLAYVVDNFPVIPMEALAPPDELEAHLSGMHPNGIALGQLNDLTYGLAYTFSTPMLYYNADLFRAAGLDPDTPPTTWQEVLEAGQAIKEATGAWGLALDIADPNFDWITQALVLSNGGRTLSEDRATLIFGEPAAVGAIQIFRDMADAEILPPFNISEAIQSMATGELAMYLQSSALQSTLMGISAGNWELRAAKMPAFDDRSPVPVNSGAALFVMSDDPIRQRAAWEFMKFVTSEEGYTIITRDIGYLPLRPQIVDDPNFLQEWADANPMVRLNLEQLEDLQPWESIPGPNYRQILSIKQRAVEEAVFGDGDVAQILMEAQDRAQQLMP